MENGKVLENSKLLVNRNSHLATTIYAVVAVIDVGVVVATSSSVGKDPRS